MGLPWGTKRGQSVPASFPKDRRSDGCHLLRLAARTLEVSPAKAQAVEEMLRLVSPVHSFARTVTEDTELHGEKLLAGQKVLIVYPSANRDPREFENPDTFDIDRNPSHVAFGLGSHFCLGANLARMEMRVAFRELLRRLPDMEFSEGGPVIVPSSLVRTCSEMKVRFTAEA